MNITLKKSGKIFFLFFLFSVSFSCEELDTLLPLTDAEITAGLKEALKVGTDSSTYHAHLTDGYYKNPLIKIPFPPEAKNAENILRNAGFGTLVDEVVLKINRAAEDAADDAKGIFINAILNMTITDALNILNGANDAATQYLKAQTYDSLRVIFKPIIESSLSSVGASQAWTTMTTTYNKIPFVTPINTDLADYSTIKALDGLFVLVAGEELKIRTDPIARVNEILQKVFGR